VQDPPPVRAHVLDARQVRRGLRGLVVISFAMADDEGKFERGILSTTSGAAVLSLAIVAAKEYGLPQEAVDAAMIAAPAMFQIVHEGYERMRDRRMKLLSVGFAAKAGSVQRAESQIDRARNAPGFETIMFETYRNLAQAVDDAVVPALGMLAGEYDFGGKQADAFFRATGRLLCDLDAEGFNALRRILREELTRCERENNESREIFVAGEDPYMPLLQHLLSAPGLNAPGKGGTSVDGFPAVRVGRETARRLQRLIDPFAGPAEPPPRIGVMHSSP